AALSAHRAGRGDSEPERHTGEQAHRLRNRARHRRIESHPRRPLPARGVPAADAPSMTFDGTCKKGFERVAQAFTRNLPETGEVGAWLCLTIGGDPVVALWGGMADPKTNTGWTRDTVSIVCSCTKGATALCAHVLASRGKLDLDAPVTELWPEF